MPLNKDREILRELAREYKEIASDPVNEERRRLHTAVNDLKMIRPVVLVNELPWFELGGDGELDLKCEDQYARRVEENMRMTIYKWKHCQGDMIVPDYFRVFKVVRETGIGIQTLENTLDKNDGNHIISHEYIDQLETGEAVDNLKIPVVTYDKEETQRKYDFVNETFGDILRPRLNGKTCYAGNWDLIARHRGVTPILMDLIDRPEHSHKVIDKYTKIVMARHKQYEELNVFEPNPLELHCTSALTSDLPGDSFDGEHVKMKHCWGRGMAQIFGSVSKEMHDEFDIEYMKKIMEPFGLVYYGCCEPLHKKIDIVSKIPNLRKISITPWADVDEAAEVMGNKYVLASKPNPSAVAVGELDEGALRAELKRILDAVKRNGCSCDIVLKDISTVGGNPKNLTRWSEIAMDMVNNY